jgi:hypothetical protein
MLFVYWITWVQGSQNEIRLRSAKKFAASLKIILKEALSPGSMRGRDVFRWGLLADLGYVKKKPNPVRPVKETSGLRIRPVTLFLASVAPGDLQDGHITAYEREIGGTEPL